MLVSAIGAGIFFNRDELAKAIGIAFFQMAVGINRCGYPILISGIDTAFIRLG